MYIMLGERRFMMVTIKLIAPLIEFILIMCMAKINKAMLSGE
ncbi:hypothetical protein BTN50_1047 [Candidatus Enterovibrio altilux]|uniref:Uncharacterized protein n=1 Tax=Candidatus Enterovibrio altilux TaxID=1927128 RepID=A0A291B969_9GAMM|nr:hypothetical protein BTN50_1047 [Candidatus Enterovibrio luxaltus]